MKYPLPAAVLAASVLVAGCNSLDNPLGGIKVLESGHDARVYNAQTGEFEWPKDKQKPRDHRPAPAMAGTSPAPQQSDGRYYDAAKNEWIDVREERSASPKPRKTAAAAPVLMVTPAPVGTPPPVRPPRARGIYNPSSGQIEWNDFDPAPAAAPAPAPKKKSWYWPF